MSNSGKELKKLLGRTNGLNESDAEDDDDDDDDDEVSIYYFKKENVLTTLILIQWHLPRFLSRCVMTVLVKYQCGFLGKARK